MTIDDVPKLKLEADWMYERFRDFFECDMGHAFIIEEQGRAICAFGGLYEWGSSGAGACEVWFNLIEKRRIFNVARIVKRLVAELAKHYKITRMQAIVGCENAINNRFMRFLGFVNETPDGMKKKMYDGRDAYLYSRCF